MNNAADFESFKTKKNCKKTHTRFYTESTAIDEKINQLKNDSEESHKNLRRYNYASINSNFKEKQLNNNNKKNTMIQKSIFNQITLFSPKLKKFKTQVHHCHPLKEYVISLQNQCRFNKISLQSIKHKKQKQELPHQEIKHTYRIIGEHPNYENCKILIEEIFKQIQRFRDVGFTDKKINEWILKYCIIRRKYMINLLMKPVNKRKFHNKIDYVFQKKATLVKEKLLNIKKVINGVERYIDQYDLRQFLQHMEQILIQKNNLKINELRSSIEQKLEECFIYNRQQNQNRFKSRKQNGQVTNFIFDLNNIENQLGKFKNISNLNRSYFNMLGNAQRKLRSKVNDMVNIKQHKKILIFDQLQSSTN